MSDSDEYKRGWYDGYQAAKSVDITRLPIGPGRIESTVKCKICSMEAFSLYVCPRTDCPTKITCTSLVDSDWQKDHDRSKY